MNEAAINLFKYFTPLSLNVLENNFRKIAETALSENEFYYSFDWSPEFYRKQAKLGFIAITDVISGYLFLTPQLQSEYAVLDWENLHVSRKVKKIIKNRMADENINLNISDNPETVLYHLDKVWREITWLTPEYEDLIKKLASTEERAKDSSFCIHAVTLTAGEDNKVICGELGYSIGKTYTSLTGFFHRDERRYSNFGKLQMVLLAVVLENNGYEFWNLGHPYMEYKLDLGAEIIPRGEFLRRWDAASSGAMLSFQDLF